MKENAEKRTGEGIHVQPVAVTVCHQLPNNRQLNKP